jgi:hypothetical protein
VFARRCEVARQQLHQLALANQQGLDEEWEFNEWLHGQTGLPMGYRRQAWSSAMYLFADAAARHGRLPPLLGLWKTVAVPSGSAPPSCSSCEPSVG